MPVLPILVAICIGALIAAIVSAARWWNRPVTDWLLVIVLVAVGVAAVVVTDSQVNDYWAARASETAANEIEPEPSLDDFAPPDAAQTTHAASLPVEMIGLPVSPRGRITGAAAPAAADNPYFRRPGEPMPVLLPTLAGNR